MATRHIGICIFVDKISVSSKMRQLKGTKNSFSGYALDGDFIIQIKPTIPCTTPPPHTRRGGTDTSKAPLTPWLEGGPPQIGKPYIT